MLEKDCGKNCKARKLNREDAMDQSVCTSSSSNGSLCSTDSTSCWPRKGIVFSPHS